MEHVEQYKNEFLQVVKRPRKIVTSTINLACVVFWALMLWKGFIAATNSDSPIVVVLSGSMEPAFQRGDILFLSNRAEHIYAGDIVVFNIKGRDIPIVHRVISTHEDTAGEKYYLTKGDNNQVDDRGLYNARQLWIKRSDINGVIQGYVPYAGMATIIMNDYPIVKWIVIGIMSVFVILGRD